MEITPVRSVSTSSADIAVELNPGKGAMLPCVVLARKFVRLEDVSTVMFPAATAELNRLAPDIPSIRPAERQASSRNQHTAMAR